MTERLRTNSENRYSIATANVLDKSTLRAALLWGISDHTELARQSGYNGIELWPQRNLMSSLVSGNTSEEDRAMILSAHQSPRSGFQLKDLRHPKKIFKELQVAVFLPEEKSSLGDLIAIREIIGDMPVVLYHGIPRKEMDISPFSTKGIQTYPEAAYAWGSKDAQSYVSDALKHGYTNIVIDTHHIRRPHINGSGNPLSSWQESIPVLLPYVNEIHLGIGRTDHGVMDPEQMRKEADDLLNGGTENTEVVQMLRFIAEKGWNGLVVIELLPGIYKEFIKQGMSIEDIYRQIRNNLHKTLDV